MKISLATCVALDVFSLLQYNDWRDVSMMIKRTGKYRVSAINKLYNNHLYLGKENDIVMSRSFTNKFVCEYQLQLYPFDRQVCSIILVMQVIEQFFLTKMSACLICKYSE